MCNLGRLVLAAILAVPSSCFTTIISGSLCEFASPRTIQNPGGAVILDCAVQGFRGSAPVRVIAKDVLIKGDILCSKLDIKANMVEFQSQQLLVHDDGDISIAADTITFSSSTFRIETKGEVHFGPLEFGHQSHISSSSTRQIEIHASEVNIDSSSSTDCSTSADWIIKPSSTLRLSGDICTKGDFTFEGDLKAEKQGHQTIQANTISGRRITKIVRAPGHLTLIADGKLKVNEISHQAEGDLEVSTRLGWLLDGSLFAQNKLLVRDHPDASSTFSHLNLTGTSEHVIQANEVMMPSVILNQEERVGVTITGQKRVSVGAVVSAGPVDIRTQAQGGDRCAVEIGNKGVEVSNNKLTVTGDLCLKGSLKSRGAELKGKLFVPEDGQSGATVVNAGASHFSVNAVLIHNEAGTKISAGSIAIAGSISSGDTLAGKGRLYPLQARAEQISISGDCAGAPLQLDGDVNLVGDGTQHMLSRGSLLTLGPISKYHGDLSLNSSSLKLDVVVVSFGQLDANALTAMDLGGDLTSMGGGITLTSPSISFTSPISQTVLAGSSVVLSSGNHVKPAQDLTLQGDTVLASGSLQTLAGSLSLMAETAFGCLHGEIEAKGGLLALGNCVVNHNIQGEGVQLTGKSRSDTPDDLVIDAGPGTLFVHDALIKPSGNLKLKGNQVDLSGPIAVKGGSLVVDSETSLFVNTIESLSSAEGEQGVLIASESLVLPSSTFDAEGTQRLIARKMVCRAITKSQGSLILRSGDIAITEAITVFDGSLHVQPPPATLPTSRFELGDKLIVSDEVRIGSALLLFVGLTDQELSGSDVHMTGSKIEKDEGSLTINAGDTLTVAANITCREGILAAQAEFMSFEGNILTGSGVTLEGNTAKLSGMGPQLIESKKGPCNAFCQVSKQAGNLTIRTPSLRVGNTLQVWEGLAIVGNTILGAPKLSATWLSVDGGLTLNGLGTQVLEAAEAMELNGKLTKATPGDVHVVVNLTSSLITLKGPASVEKGKLSVESPMEFASSLLHAAGGLHIAAPLRFLNSYETRVESLGPILLQNITKEKGDLAISSPALVFINGSVVAGGDLSVEGGHAKVAGNISSGGRATFHHSLDFVGKGVQTLNTERGQPVTVMLTTSKKEGDLLLGKEQLFRFNAQGGIFMGEGMLQVIGSLYTSQDVQAHGIRLGALTLTGGLTQTVDAGKGCLRVRRSISKRAGDLILGGEECIELGKATVSVSAGTLLLYDPFRADMRPRVSGGISKLERPVVASETSSAPRTTPKPIFSSQPTPSTSNIQPKECGAGEVWCESAQACFDSDEDSRCQLTETERAISHASDAPSDAFNDRREHHAAANDHEAQGREDLESQLYNDQDPNTKGEGNMADRGFRIETVAWTFLVVLLVTLA